MKSILIPLIAALALSAPPAFADGLPTPGPHLDAQGRPTCYLSWRQTARQWDNTIAACSIRYGREVPFQPPPFRIDFVENVARAARVARLDPGIARSVRDGLEPR